MFKRFNIFLFLSSIAKNMIEVFIPIVLYKKGYSFNLILWFFLIKFSTAILFNYITIFIGSKLRYSLMLMISFIVFGGTFYYLNTMSSTLNNLIIFSIGYGIYNYTYYPCRHYYALSLMHPKNVCLNSGSMIIASQIALMPASYIGGLIIETFNFKLLIIITVLISFLSLIPLIKIDNGRKQHPKLHFFKILKDMPKASLWFYVFEQFRVLLYYLLPLFVYLYINQSLKYIGLFFCAPHESYQK